MAITMQRKIGNPNHPSKGSQIRVDAIRKVEDVAAIKRMLSAKPRDLLLFTLGINNGLRAGDLLRLKVKAVSHLKPGEHITIKESKTGKQNVLMVNKASHKALRQYLIALHPSPDSYLFASRKGNAPITTQRVNQMVKEWTGAINLPGNYGAHTLRKTFGFIQRTVFGVGFEVLCQRFNHGSPRVTMRYLGLSSDEVNGVLLNDI